MTPIEELIERATVSGIGSVALRQLRDAYAAECMEQAQARANDRAEILALEAEVARLKSDGACQCQIDAARVGWGDWPTSASAGEQTCQNQ